MKTQIDTMITTFMDPTLMRYGSIISIVIGIILVICGIICLKKKKNWAWFLLVIGIVSIVTNISQVFLY